MTTEGDLLRAVQSGSLSEVVSALDAGVSPDAVIGEETLGFHSSFVGESAISKACMGAPLPDDDDYHPVVNVQMQWGMNGPFFYPLDLVVKGIVEDPGPMPQIERALPLLLRAGAIFPTPYYSGLLSAGDAGDPLLSYLDRVLTAGGFRRYEQRHINALAATFGPKLGLPPEIARVVVTFYAHCGFY